MVTAYNVRLQGTLSVQKVVENADNSPLTEEQKQQEFNFYRRLLRRRRLFVFH